MRYGYDHTQLREYRCKRCGRIFIPAALHSYKSSEGFYCSYTCMLNAEREREEALLAKRRRIKRSGKPDEKEKENDL